MYCKLSTHAYCKSTSEQINRSTFYIQRCCSWLKMGRIDKGVNCSVQGCEEKGERSITSSKAQMAPDLNLDITNKRAYLCKSHYKEWKKATKGERENERARWA